MGPVGTHVQVHLKLPAEALDVQIFKSFYKIKHGSVFTAIECPVCVHVCACVYSLNCHQPLSLAWSLLARLG